VRRNVTKNPARSLHAWCCISESHPPAGKNCLIRLSKAVTQTRGPHARPGVAFSRRWSRGSDFRLVRGGRRASRKRSEVDRTRHRHGRIDTSDPERNRRFDQVSPVEQGISGPAANWHTLRLSSWLGERNEIVFADTLQDEKHRGGVTRIGD
jgi:hypothetical protein